MLLMLLVSLATASAKCDWSSLKLQQWSERNYYKWYLSGRVLDDTCVDYLFMVYDFQTKKVDTLQSFRGLVEVEFNVKGRYKMYVKVNNYCDKCDTVIYREVNLINFPGANVSYRSTVNDCKKFIFEMSYINGYSLKDSCMQYYMLFYKGPWMDTMSSAKWDSLTNYQIAAEYDFPDADYLGYTMTRVADFTFTDTGRVLMIAQWWDGCLRQDTFMFRKLDVCSSKQSLSVKVINKPEPRLLGVYDIMGRKVEFIRKDELMIYLYDDGSTRKVIQH